MHDETADWHVVLQDDAIPCPDFMEALPTVLKSVPGEGPISFYMGTRRPAPDRVAQMAKKAQTERASWIGLPFLGWGVGFAVPVALIEEMLDDAGGRKLQPYDTRIGRYFRNGKSLPTWYTWPSLVQHAQGRSLVGRHGADGRKAFRFLTSSALDVDWSAGVVVDERAKRLATG